MPVNLRRKNNAVNLDVRRKKYLYYDRSQYRYIGHREVAL